MMRKALIGCLLAASVAAAAAASGSAAFLARYCTECHDKDTKKGNLDLTALKPDFSDPDTFARWVKVHDRIAAGEMPPKKAAQPALGEVQPVLAGLRGQLHAASLARQQREGRVALRRLNRTEYETTLSDLLGINVKVADLLPDDNSAAGF